MDVIIFDHHTVPPVLPDATALVNPRLVEQVSRRPTFYMPGGVGGFDTWALSGRLIQFVPAQ